MTAPDRDRVAMRPPTIDLSGFPRKTIDADRTWWRNHGTLGPWYFDSGPGGRFNLDSPDGTLYLATTPRAAATERIGFALTPQGSVPASVVADRFISGLTLPIAVGAAHAATTDASRWGAIPSEMATAGYALTRLWAAAFAAAGFSAIWAMLRFSAPHGRVLAVFGAEGPRPWPVPHHTTTLRDFVETTMRLTVIDPPSSRELTILN